MTIPSGRDLFHALPAALRLWRTISFSQYIEDSVFFTLFQPSASGFYVDVGAFHPIEASNTYKLYLKGWRGITIEPNPAVAKLFRRKRPRDTHIVQGISQTHQTIPYYKYKLANLNTFSVARAKELEISGCQLMETEEVKCSPLAAVIAQAAPDRHIDLLSIDCEGMDLEVLRTFDFAKKRPTTIIIEDFDGYRLCRDGGGQSAIQSFLRGNMYMPISQMLYSFLYVAADWPTLMKLSHAFDPKGFHDRTLPQAHKPHRAGATMFVPSASIIPLREVVRNYCYDLPTGVRHGSDRRT
jgi:FkbM family methyltransferase